MNLFLLLSALVSALTGLQVGPARPPVAAERIVQAGAAIERIAARPVAVARHVQTVSVAAARTVSAPVRRLVVAVVPLFASRRRE